MKKTIHCCLFMFLLFYINTLHAANEMDSLQTVASLDIAKREMSLKLSTSLENLDFSNLDQYINNYIKENGTINSSPNFDPRSDNLLEEGIAKEKAYSGNPDVQKANEAIQKVLTNASRLVEQFAGASLIDLPVGKKFAAGKSNIILVLNKITFTPTEAVVEVYGGVISEGESIDNPRRLLFGASGIKYSGSGGFVGGAKLGLFSDYPMFQKSKHILLTLKGMGRGGGGTYIELDCDGFKKIQIEADLELSKDWVLPCDENGTPMNNAGRVKSHFLISVNDLKNFVVGISLPTFTPTKIAGKVAFKIQNAVFDHSDLENAPGFSLYEGYDPSKFAPPSQTIVQESGVATGLQERAIAEVMGQTNGDSEGDEEEDADVSDKSELDKLWRGVYIQELKIILPKAFKRNENERLAVQSKDLYVDNQGVTGYFALLNLIPYESGKMKKWKFSVDNMNISLVSNTPVRFGFEGRIGIPIADETKPFTYGGGGDLVKNQYNFFLKLQEEMEFPLWKADNVSLHEGSYIKVVAENDEFDGEAVLHGTLRINVTDQTTEKGESSKSSFKADSIVFREVTLVTKRPYLLLGDGGFVRLEKDAKLNNSPFTIKEAYLGKDMNQPEKVFLSFEATLSLADEADGGSSATGGFAIIAKMDESDGTQQWKYDGLEIKSICVTIDFGKAGKISGCVYSYNGDKIYGTGWQGQFTGKFMKGEGKDNYKLIVDARAIFGNTESIDKGNGYKFWYFSGYIAMSDFSIPLIPGVINMNGFGGGVYYHMKMLGELDPEKILTMSASAPLPVTYIPDKETVFGFKVCLGLTTPSNAFVANVTLEMDFSAKSLQNVRFYGKGEFLAKGTSPQFETGDKIEAAVTIHLNFEKGFYMHGAFAVEMDLQNRLTGSASMDILATDGNWHIYVGGYADGSVKTDSAKSIFPVSVSIKIKDDLFVIANAYFLMGNDIPGPPPLSAAAANFFNVSTKTTRSNEGAISQGAGFAFGLGVDFSLQAKKEDCKYVDFRIAAGLDFSLLKYGPTAVCSGQSNNANQGLNGWRATGRLYAFVAFGGKWKILWKCKNLPSFQAGVLLQIDVPNPNYFDAYVVFKVIGISVKAHGSIGTECGRLNG